MYEVKIINNGISTTIHYPTADISAPHLPKIGFKESLSLPDALSFTILPNNLGYDLIEGLLTKVKVTDLTDNKIVFSGRAMPVKSNMSSNGLFYKDVVCEGAMAYLNDSQTRRWNLTNQTPTQILTYLLSQHNNKMDVSRKIFLGVIEITQPITLDTNYETTLNTIITKVKNVLGGDLKVREINGLLHLDYLIAQGTDNNVKIELGYNMKDIIEEYDPLDIVSRVIPLGYGEGINQLDIKKVNSNIEYLDNITSIAKYGVVEGVATNKDIQSATTLKIYGNTVLKDKSQARLAISTNALDLSVLAGHEAEKYSNGDSLNIVNLVMSIDVIARVVERSFDLLAPQNPQLTISTRAIRLTDQIIELKQRNLTLENAPQGSTYIDTFGYAENIDETHSFKLPIWLSPDILNVNRVRLHIDSQKYRAYEKGLESGGGSTSASANGGGFTPTSSGGGNHKHKLFNYDEFGLIVDTVTPFSAGNVGGVSSSLMLRTNITEDIYTLQASGDHTHAVTVPKHTHAVTIPAHQHTIEYGILEETYPGGVQIKINGVAIPDVVLSDGGALDLDITTYIGAPGENYNLEVTSSRNGRVNVWVSIQAFIQAK